MENPTQFDLNKTIFQWRAKMSAAEGMSTGSLDELEGHLRDSMEALNAKGLTAEECFLIASHRLGMPEALAREFDKPNASLVWSRRAFWMAAGIISFDIARRVTNGAVLLSMGLGHSSGLQGYQVLAFAIAVSLLVPGIFAAAWWRSVINPRSKFDRWERWFRTHPAALWGLAFAAVPVGTGIYLVIARYYMSQLGIADFAKFSAWNSWLTMFTSVFLWPGLLLWLVHRINRLARVAR